VLWARAFCRILFCSGVAVLSPFGFAACDGADLAAAPPPVIPVHEFWEVGANLESHLPPQYRDRAEQLLKNIARRSPRTGNHLFHWSEDPRKLEGFDLEIRWLESSSPRATALFGGQERLAFTTLAMSIPQPQQRLQKATILYFVFVDHFFLSPARNNEEAWAELELNLAGDLLGRIGPFLTHIQSAPHEFRRGLGEAEYSRYLDHLACAARVGYLREEQASPEFSRRADDVRIFLNNEMKNQQRQLENFELVATAKKLKTVVPFEIALDFMEDAYPDRLLPNFRKSLGEMLERLSRLAPAVSADNLFHWSSSREALENKTYTLLLTSRDHPRWADLGVFLPEYGSGATLVEPAGEGSESKNIVQILYVDALIPRELPVDRRAALLEAALAFEILGKSHYMLGADFRSRRPSDYFRDKVGTLKADLKGAEAQKEYVRRLIELPIDQYPEKDRIQLRQLLLSADAALDYHRAKLSDLQRRP
jgi:hypothetical protein